MIGLLWAFLQHFCAGLRYLAIDLHRVRNLTQARNSSKVVMAASIALTVFDRSKAMVNRVVVGAHYGLRDWLVQRITGGGDGGVAVWHWRVICCGKDALIMMSGRDCLPARRCAHSSLLFLLSLFYHGMDRHAGTS